MDEGIKSELKLLRDEYKWLLKGEVQHILQDVRNALMEASKRFPIRILPDSETVVKPDKLKLVSTNPNFSSSASSIRCVVTLLGESITEADIALKLNKQQPMALQLRICPDAPWRLQQIQDAGNYLLRAFCALDSFDHPFQFAQPSQLISLLNDITTNIIRARSCLSQPCRKTLEELLKNPNMRVVKPSLPSDLVISFYIHAEKLILNVYHLLVNHNQKIDIQSKYQLECIVPWLNDVLILFAAALRHCQQLADKMYTFNQLQQELDLLVIEHHTTSEQTHVTRQNSAVTVLMQQQHLPSLSQLLASERKRTSLFESATGSKASVFKGSSWSTSKTSVNESSRSRGSSRKTSKISDV